MFAPNTLRPSVILTVAMVAAVVTSSTATAQDPLLAPGDFIIAIDTDPPAP